MAGCNWCGTTEVKLAENKPYCPDCTFNCKRECAVCHKPYPNLKFGNLVIQLENKNNMTVMKNPSLLEKKRRRRRRRRRKLKMIALIEESLKKIAQMRPPVKLRTFKKLLLHLQKDN